ncbi:MAG: TIGR02588 family protein [Oculatellaceae cyanobacterium Prado106]|jgi:uncharacterized protein (TIGR02588 family)|nr:TIGR02588 family protein [Oculatellaceae cyanobacterium Prado106]
MNRKSHHRRFIHAPSAEGVTFAIALIIVAIVIGLVFYSWSLQTDEPPILSVTAAGETRQAAGQYYIPFKATNQGGETAASVQIIGELRINGMVEESGEQQIDFLSPGEEEEGAFVFQQNPQNGQVVLRVASYHLP